MDFYWVNVGKTIKEVLNGDFLWAPEASRTKSGQTKRLEHWDNVAEVKAGDIVFCCHDQTITHIAEASRNAYQAKRPPTRSFSEWADLGNRVDVGLTTLRNPIRRDDIANDFIARYDSQCLPPIFTRDATLKQIYMARLPKDAGVYLLEMAHLVEAFELTLVDKEGPGKLSTTTREAIVKARVGQGKFRTDLLRRWGNQCSLTGLSNTDLLIASHIHAWSLSNNDERIDPENGLLLAPHIDRMFDRGLISFDNGGRLLIGESLPTVDQRALGLDRYAALRNITAANRRYMALHRRRFGFEH